MPDSAALNVMISRDSAAGVCPYPDGWYAVGFSDELKPGGLQTRRFMGRELVLFRTTSGRAAAVDDFCPHMGRSVSTTYRRRLSQARLDTWPLRERHGILLIYYHHQGRAPDWEVPEEETTGWSRLYHGRLSARAHPQETSENSAGLGHFSAVHRHEDVELIDLYIEGPYLRSRFAFHRKADPLGRGSRRVRSEFTAHLHGLGYSMVEVYIPALGLHTRHFVLATPVGDGSLELRLALRLRNIDRPARLHWLLRPAPPELVSRLVAWASFKTYVHDVKQALPSWQHKQYVHPPRLAAGDGPIGRYRRWARQFYPDEGRSLPDPDEGSISGGR